jgi:hypothetical protein
VSPEEPQRLPTQHMGMNVKDGLPGITVGVEHNPIPTLKDAFELSNLTSSSNNLTQELRIPSRKLPKVPIPLLRHHEHMNPSLRPNIPKGKGRRILKDHVSRNLTSNDPLEERLVLTHAGDPIDHPATPRTHTKRGPEVRARQRAF